MLHCDNLCAFFMNYCTFSRLKKNFLCFFVLRRDINIKSQKELKTFGNWPLSRLNIAFSHKTFNVKPKNNILLCNLLHNINMKNDGFKHFFLLSLLLMCVGRKQSNINT